VRCLCGNVLDTVADMLGDAPDEDADQFAVECCHRPFPSVYYLQLDSCSQ